jgi:hypothetical protein
MKDLCGFDVEPFGKCHLEDRKRDGMLVLRWMLRK